MSTKVVPAPAANATQPVRSKKLAKQAESKESVQEEEERVAEDDSDEEIVVADAETHEKGAPVSETSLAGNFAFNGALAEAAAASGSLTTEGEADAEVSYGQFGGEDGSGGTILLVGAVLLVGLGIAALASGGDNNNDTPVPPPPPPPPPPPNNDPTVAVDLDTIELDGVGLTQDFVVTTTDDDGDTVTVTGSADNGTVNDGGDDDPTTFTYVPNADFMGSDTITFTADDGNGGTATATVAATIDTTNALPVQGPQTTTDITVDNDKSAMFLIDFTDPDGDDAALTSAVTMAPANGTIDGTTNTYTPTAGFEGTDSFEITVTDQDGGTTSYTVNVTISAPTTTTQSIDVPASGPAVVIDASDDEFIFTDTVGGRTDVVLNGFTDNDVIQVTGAAAGDYFFGTSPSDPNDLRITFNDGTNFTQIIIDDILPPGGPFVTDAASAIARVGFEFITFG